MKKAWYVLCILSLGAKLNGQTVQAPLSLNSAIEIGLKNNPEIVSAAEKVKASKGRLLSAIAPASPELSISHDYIPAGQNINNYGEKTIGVSQSIEFPTNYFLRGSKFSKEKEIAEQEYAVVKNGVILNVKTAYFKLLAHQEQVKIARENLAIAGDFVKKAEVRLALGEGTNLEKLTAQVQYSEAINDVEVQKNRLITACTELNFALGFGKDEQKEYRLTDTLGYSALDLTLSQLIDNATGKNPQLKINKLRFGSFSVDKSLAWSSLLPNFNLAYFNKQIRGGMTVNGNYGASINISVPLWFMLDQRGKIQEAYANASGAESELRSTLNAVYTKIQNTFTEFKDEEKQVQLYQKDILPHAEEIYRTAAKSYEAGEITYIEFLQSQQTIMNSRSKYMHVLLSYNLSIVSIEEAIGNQIR
jgi:heavy metal efflux system protein